MTHTLTTRDLVGLAQQAGYHVVAAEQLRSNRWLLTLRDPAQASVLVLVQARPLVTAADVLDLADLVRLRADSQGLLLAYGGAFSPAAQRTLAELPGARLRLCTALPPAAAEADERAPRGAALRSAP